MILINSSPKDALKLFQPFLPIFVPVGIGCLLAALKQRGIKACFIDEQVEENTIALVQKYAKDMNPPYIFGFSVLTAAYKSAISVSKELKKLYPDSIILFGGIHPTALPEEVLSNEHVDFVIQGEGEKSLYELYRCLKKRESYSHIDNLVYRHNGNIVKNNRVFIFDNLDSYPPFPYDLFDSKQYDLGFVVSSRGCPYRCIFCSNRITTGRKYRYRHPESIINELDLLSSHYKKRYVQFLDDNFLVNKDRIYNLIEGIKKRDLDKKMTFNFQARGDNVEYKLLKDLYNAGFRSIFFGIETASEKIMKVIKKDETVKQCIKGIKIAKEIGFHISATFIYALPKETYQDRMDCIKLTRDLDLDLVRYNNATHYQGTELYEIAKREGRLNILGMYENFISVSTFIENPFRKIPFSYVPQGNTENEIRRDILFSYFNFYFNLGRLKKVLTRPDQGAAWFNMGEHIFTIFRKLPAFVSLILMMFIKFGQLFHLTVIKEETRISLNHFMGVFREPNK